MTQEWTLRPNRQRKAPLAIKGLPCDWCVCANCTGSSPAFMDTFSVLLADGSRMCDTCWQYPPCGGSDDCIEFDTLGTCSHRPEQAEGATWEPYADVLARLPPETGDWVSTWLAHMATQPGWIEPTRSGPEGDQPLTLVWTAEGRTLALQVRPDGVQHILRSKVYRPDDDPLTSDAT